MSAPEQALLEQALRALAGCVRRLEASLAKLAPLFPLDADKLETELGWKAQENFDTGIRRTVQWYLDNDWWWRPIREKKYAGERLGKA